LIQLIKSRNNGVGSMSRALGIHLTLDRSQLIRALVPDLTESDLRKAIAWALRQLPLRSPHPPRHRRQLRDSRFFGCRRKKL
jgi:hypothetical protein